MLVQVHSNIWDIEADALVVPVNTVGVMGAGLAREAARLIPGLERDYRNYCKFLKPGKMVAWTCPNGRYIVLGATKQHWQQPSQYEWVRLLASEIHHWAVRRSVGSIAMPILGGGLGKLQPSLIENIISDEFALSQVVVYLTDGKDRGKAQPLSAQALAQSHAQPKVGTIPYQN